MDSQPLPHIVELSPVLLHYSQEQHLYPFMPVYGIQEISPSKPLLTVKQTASFLNVCEDTIRNWITQGELPFVRLGRKLIRIKRSTLERMTEEQIRH